MVLWAKSVCFLIKIHKIKKKTLKTLFTEKIKKTNYVLNNYGENQ